MTQTMEMSAEEVVERVRAGQIPMSARVTVTLDLAASSGEAPVAATSSGEAASNQWKQEERELTPEEAEEEERIFEQLHRNMNETRRSLGMREI